VKVPKIHPFSTEHVTFMEFLPTQKLTESFPGDRERNAILAARLAAVVTLEAMFAKPRVAIFHGDPHGGNILRLTDDPNDPYRLAMLDWGLMGEFPRKQRVQIVHLNLAMQKRNKKNMMKNIGSLIRGGLPGDPGRLETIDRLVSQTLGKKGGSFELFADLLEQLLKNGFPLDDEMSLFIKAQVTVAGILKTLDPTLSQDEMVKRKVKSLVMREFPKRVLLFPAWNYRGYRSMLSNGDVFSYAF
jgi:ubiquinone biosynthesis protein